MDEIRNETFRQRLDSKATEDFIKESQLRRFGHNKIMKGHITTGKVFETRPINKRRVVQEKYGRKKQKGTCQTR